MKEFDAEETERVAAIFQELKNQGLISPKRELKEKGNKTFKAGFFRDIIYYDPRLSKTLDDDEVRFVLLHEEGHHRDKVGTIRIVLILFLVLPSLLMDSILSPLQVRGFVWSFALTFFPISFLLLALLAMKPVFWQDEYEADLYAAKTFFETYKKKPSLVLESALMKAAEFTEKERGIFSRKIRLIFDTHPQDFERILHIKTYEERWLRNEQ